MAIYNLGAAPEAQMNPYLEMLMKFGTQSLLQSQADTAALERTKIATSAEVGKQAAELKTKEDMKLKEALDAQFQGLSDKYYDLNNRKRDDTALKAIFEDNNMKVAVKEYRRLHPEFKDLENDLDLLPQPSVEAAEIQLKDTVNKLKMQVAKDPSSVDPKIFDAINRLDGKEGAYARAFYRLNQADTLFVEDLQSQDKEIQAAAQQKFNMALQMEMGTFDVKGAGRSELAPGANTKKEVPFGSQAQPRRWKLLR